MLHVSVAICQCVKGKIGSLLAGKKVVVENRLFLLYFIFLIEGWSGPLLIGVLAVPCHEAPARGPLGAGMQPEPHCQAMHPPRDTFSYGLSIRQAMPPEAATGQKDHNFLMHKEVPYGLAGTLRVGNVAKHSRKETNKSGKKQPQKEPPQKQGLRVPGTEFVQKLS